MKTLFAVGLAVAAAFAFALPAPATAEPPFAALALEAPESPLCVDAAVEIAQIVEADDAKKCSDYGMYASGARDQCEKECQGNRKECVKRQRCGDEQCPPPGYCWKCVNHQ